jgi:nitrite reductase/ring-hydroxylating ferredoxin subunit
MSALTSRRAFLRQLYRVLAVTGLAAVAEPAGRLSAAGPPRGVPAEPVAAGPADGLAQRARVVRYGRHPALLIHTPDGRAYSAVCNHFACIVRWNPDLQRIDCPCHDGFFDPRDGHVIAGPPPEPLAALSVSVVDGQIYIGGAP